MTTIRLVIAILVALFSWLSMILVLGGIASVNNEEVIVGIIFGGVAVIGLFALGVTNDS